VVGSGLAIYAERSTLRQGLSALRHANVGWVVAGIALECLSMLSFALLQGRLLRLGGARLTLSVLLATAYTSNAIAVGVPVAGSGIATAYSLGQLRRGGGDVTAVSFALALSGAFSTITFSLVVAAGALVSGSPAAALLGGLTGLVVVAAIALIVVLLRSTRGRAQLERLSAWTLTKAQRIVHRPAGDPVAITTTAVTRLASFKLGPGTAAYLMLCGLINWVTDALCLAVAIIAIGVPVPWTRLILVWSAGAAAGSLAPTPFGLGVVDIALISALVGTGLQSADAVGAVLLYRIITFKILVTLLWVAYRYLDDARQRARSARAMGNLGL
jgi:uncharacterized protein (TIRG00374 family)